jgi:predicted dehydrogenase
VDRRIFLKDLTLLAASTAIAGSYPWFELFKEETGKRRMVRLGIIGIGDRGRGLLLNLQQIEGVEIAAVCDNYQPNFERAIKLTGGKAKAYKDYLQLLNDESLEGVVIATPLYEHARITMDAFSRGKHVFCEKAMVMTFVDCYNMVQAQKTSKKILQIGHQRMFDHRYIKALQDIEDGKLGQLGQIRGYWHRNGNWRRHVPGPELERKINWRMYNEYSLGLTTELASHHIQVANWVYDEIPESVSGSGSIVYWKDGREVYDNIQMVFRYPSGRHLVYDSMISNKKYGLELQVMGDKGTMELESNRFYSEKPPAPAGILQWINNAEKDIFETIPIGGASWIPETASKYQGKPILNNGKKDIPPSTLLSLEAFVESVRKDKVYPKLVAQGYYASIATIMAHLAMKEQRYVEFPKEYMI